MPDYTIEAIESAPFAQLCYVAWLAGRTDAVVIDPGFDTRSVIRLLERAAAPAGGDPQHARPRRPHRRQRAR